MTQFTPVVKDVPPKPSSEPPDEASASSTTTNSPSLQFISSEIARIPHLDFASSTPDGFQIWKERWSSAVTITGFSALSQETQLPPFTNVLSEDTVEKRTCWPSLMSMLSLKLSRPRYVGPQVSLFTNMSFIIESKGQMNLFKNFTPICNPS